VVLLHATMGSSRRFYAWVPHLSRDFRVVRLDVRGHGQSDAPDLDTGLTFDRLVLDVIELLDHLRVTSAHLAGSAAGGIIAQQVVLAFPERVRTLALFASSPGMKRSTVNHDDWIKEIRTKGLRRFLADNIRTRFDLDHVPPGFIDWFLDESAKTDPNVVARFVPLMASVDLTPRLKEIRCPTLAVVPAHDPIRPASYYEVFRTEIPNVEFVTYEGLPHNITDAVPDRCAQDLRNFLLRHAKL